VKDEQDCVDSNDAKKVNITAITAWEKLNKVKKLSDKYNNGRMPVCLLYTNMRIQFITVQASITVTHI